MMRKLGLLLLLSGFINTVDVKTYESPVLPNIPADSLVIEGEAIFLDKPEIRANGFLVRCECGEAPCIVTLKYGFINAYCSEHAPLPMRSRMFGPKDFPWGNNE